MNICLECETTFESFDETWNHGIKFNHKVQFDEIMRMKPVRSTKQEKEKGEK